MTPRQGSPSAGASANATSPQGEVDVEEQDEPREDQQGADLDEMHPPSPRSPHASAAGSGSSTLDVDRAGQQDGYGVDQDGDTVMAGSAALEDDPAGRLEESRGQHQGASSANLPGAGNGGGGKRRAEADEEAGDAPPWLSHKGLEPWVTKAIENIEALDGATEGGSAAAVWGEVVHLWWELEAAEGFKGTSSLPKSSKRPSAIGQWIARARSLKYAPARPKKESEVDDWILDFKDSLKSWWSDINPEWRERDRSNYVKPRGKKGDLASLHCTGQNGLLSVLKGLQWLYEMERIPEGSKDWLSLVDDVRWVLEGLKSQFCNEHAPARKRRKE